MCFSFPSSFVLLSSFSLSAAAAAIAKGKKKERRKRDQWGEGTGRWSFFSPGSSRTPFVVTYHRELRTARGEAMPSPSLSSSSSSFFFFSFLFFSFFLSFFLSSYYSFFSDESLRMEMSQNPLLLLRSRSEIGLTGVYCIGRSSFSNAKG